MIYWGILEITGLVEYIRIINLAIKVTLILRKINQIQDHDHSSKTWENMKISTELGVVGFRFVVFKILECTTDKKI